MTEFKKITFVNSEYNPDTTLAKVTVKCGNDYFVGYAKADEKDAQRSSFLRGCSIAELKANRKALKSQLKEFKRDYEVVKEFVNRCKQSKDFDENSMTAKMIFKQEAILKNKMNFLQIGLDALDANLKQLRER